MLPLFANSLAPLCSTSTYHSLSGTLHKQFLEISTKCLLKGRVRYVGQLLSNQPIITSDTLPYNVIMHLSIIFWNC